MNTRHQAYATVIGAVVVGLVVATAFTGVISANQETQPTYDEQTADISFVSFCSDGTTTDLTKGTVSTSFDTLTYNGETKDWQVSYTLSEGVTVDYLILKGGKLGTSPGAYVLKVNDPTSPVSVFGGMDDGEYEDVTDDFPDAFGEDNACLMGDSGVKFEN